MVSTQLLTRVRYTFLLVPLVAALAGCDLSVGNLTERATEEWTRSYPLAAGGEIRIFSTTGGGQGWIPHLRTAGFKNLRIEGPYAVGVR